MPTIEIIQLALLGLFAGLIAGLAGVGASLVVLPGLALIVGYTTPDKAEQHLFIAAAFVVNFAVAIPAAWRHYKNNSITLMLFLRTFPGHVAGFLLGVVASNLVHGAFLQRWLGLVIALVVVLTLLRDWINRQSQARPPHATFLRLSSTSFATGLPAGVTGLGGGALLVPALQFVAHVPIKKAIGVSATMMCFSSLIAAPIKLATLSEHHQSWTKALTYAGILAPLVVVGSIGGAELAHRLPTRHFKWAVAAVLMAAAVKMIIG